MGLFEQRPQVGPTVQYYSLGQEKTILIVGLGNVGKQYEHSRHNIGFQCVDALVSSQPDLNNWTSQRDLHCLLAKGRLGEASVIVIKPTTLMNRSGPAVQAVQGFYKIGLEHVIVVHDELDIPFGQIRLRVGGGSAGHNGITSVSDSIGEDYGRIRIGIGPKTPTEIDSADFVLQSFNPDEQMQLSNLTKEVTAILTEYIYGGLLPHETRSFIV